jgi:hypothetical protein
MKKLILTGLLFFMMSIANFANAAEIDSAYFNGNSELRYPLVTVKNADAAAKINAEIRKEIKRITDDIYSRAGDELKEFSINYEIPCNHKDGILSIILSGYVYIDKAAHPWHLVSCLNFNSDSGVKLTADSLSEIAKHGNDYTPKELTRKLKIYSKKNNRPLYDYFKQLDEIPETFYFDDNLHVHFLFEEQTVAPYAVGIIDLDADAKY